MECQDCGYTCDTKDKFDKHLKIHAVNLRCVKCEFNAKTRADWQTHITSQKHLDAHTCHHPLCTFVGETWRVLKDHERGHLRKKKSKEFKCSKCEFATDNGPTLKKHALEHRKEEIMASSMQQFKCHICSYSAESERKYKNHMWKHGAKKDFKCDRCDYSAQTEATLISHKRKHYDEDEGVLFECETCSKAFKTRDALKGHQRLHKQRSSFKCPLSDQNCFFVTTMAEYLRAHCRNQHPNVSVYKCTKCDFFTCDTEALEKHVEEQHAAGTFFSCDRCEYVTDKEKNFLSHKTNKHAPVKKSRCVICKVVMPSREALEDHMQTHRELPRKTFQCTRDNCKYKTNKYSEYRQHFDAHLQNETPEESRARLDLEQMLDKKPNIDGSSPVYAPLNSSFSSTSNASPSSSSYSSSSSQNSRVMSPGAYDFKKNVAGFLAKKRGGESSGGFALAALKSQITITPVVLKEETGQYFCPDNDDLGANPELKPDVGDTAKCGNFSRDVKPDINDLPRPNSRGHAVDIKPMLHCDESQADVKPFIA